MIDLGVYPLVRLLSFSKALMKKGYELNTFDDFIYTYQYCAHV